MFIILSLLATRQHFDNHVMSGIIHCEFIVQHRVVQTFQIGFFSPSSCHSTPSVSVLSIRKAVLQRLNRLDKSPPADAKLIHKQSGLHYINDAEYILSGTTITVKLQPTTSRRIKFYDRVNIQHIILNGNSNPTNWDTIHHSNPCAESSNQSKRSSLSPVDVVKVSKEHNGLSLDLLPLSVIEDEVECKTMSTRKGDEGSCSETSESTHSSDTGVDGECQQKWIEEQQMKIIQRMQDRVQCKAKVVESRYNVNRNRNGNGYTVSGGMMSMNRGHGMRGRGGRYQKYHHRHSRQRERREFVQDLMDKYDPKKYVPSFSFTEYSPDKQTNQLKVVRDSCNVPALAFIRNQNNVKFNPFERVQGQKQAEPLLEKLRNYIFWMLCVVQYVCSVLNVNRMSQIIYLTSLLLAINRNNYLTNLHCLLSVKTDHSMNQQNQS